jgi:hypothetical protein
MVKTTQTHNEKTKIKFLKLLILNKHDLYYVCAHLDIYTYFVYMKLFTLSSI